MRRTQQVLPPENVPERPLLRHTIAKLIFDMGLSDIDHDMADWLYYREDLFAVADQIIERWIDHPQVSILEHWIDPICGIRGCQCTLMKEQMQEVRDAAKKEIADATNARAGSSGSAEPSIIDGGSASHRAGSMEPSVSTSDGGESTTDVSGICDGASGRATSDSGGTPVRTPAPAKPRRSRAHVSKRGVESSAERVSYANGDADQRSDGYDPKAA